MSNSKKLTKHAGGRPTIYSDSIVQKLTSVLRMGGTVEQSCSYAKISKETYYAWLKDKPEFSDEMEGAKHFLNIAAKNVVGNSIIRDKNDTNAKWWLEKTEFKNLQYQTNVQVNMGVEFIQDGDTS